jgi:Flp pilus assembly protein TadD
MRLAAAVLATLVAGGSTLLATGCGPGDSGSPPGPVAGPPAAELPVAERLRRGHEFLAGERLADAAAEYRAALSRDATCVPALEGLSRIAARMNDAPASLAFISRAAQLAPEDGSIVNQLGVALVSNDRKREAAGKFERAMELRPRDPLVLLNAAQNQADLGDWERARRYAEGAAALIPEDATPWLLLGRFQMRQEKFADAVAPLREAARRAPDQGTIQYYLGKSLVAAGRRREAEEPLRAALRSNPPPEVRRDVEALLAR